jgi:hypothetical protein
MNGIGVLLAAATLEIAREVEMATDSGPQVTKDAPLDS